MPSCKDGMSICIPLVAFAHIHGKGICSTHILGPFRACPLDVSMECYLCGREQTFAHFYSNSGSTPYGSVAIYLEFCCNCQCWVFWIRPPMPSRNSQVFRCVTDSYTKRSIRANSRKFANFHGWHAHQCACLCHQGAEHACTMVPWNDDQNLSTRCARSAWSARYEYARKKHNWMTIRRNLCCIRTAVHRLRWWYPSKNQIFSTTVYLLSIFIMPHLDSIMPYENTERSYNTCRQSFILEGKPLFRARHR